MDQREAKRRACRIAAMALDGVIATELRVFYLDDDEELTAVDEERLLAALGELTREMQRRGGEG
jgi:hypothetical protein